MTMESRRSREREALNRAIVGYETAGYEVSLEEQLEFPHGGFRADAVARRGDETVVIEVRSTDLSDQDRQRFARLAEIVTAQHGWQVDLVTYEPVPQPLVPRRLDVLRRVTEAGRVSQASPDGAVMLIWSAIEGALLRLKQRRGLGPTHPVPPSALIRQLNIDGILTDGQAEELRHLARIRNDIAHGLSSRVLGREQLRQLSMLARALVAADEALGKVGDMIEWFHANYLTPEEAALFYDSEEGDYVWLGSGPHDPTDVLRNQFATAPESDIAKAVRAITERGSDWAQRDRL